MIWNKINTKAVTLIGSNALDDDSYANGWIKLVDYGEYPHRLGMQVVDRSACEHMAKHFSSLCQRLARRFRGVPIFIGHPDDPNYRGQAGHGDTRAYGWVKFLEAREDGLWVYPRWSQPGRDLLENAHFKFFSPRWELVPLGGDRFSPKQLISIGFTNHPNIEVEAIANQDNGNTFPAGMICKKNGEIEDAPPPMKGFKPQEEDMGSLTVNLWESLRKATAKIEKFDENSSETSVEAPKNEQSTDGAHLISPQKRAWPIAANCAHLSADTIGRQSFTQFLGQKNGFSNELKKYHVLTLVRERMDREHESFPTAWSGVKRDHPFLFEN
jgi:hypothetical protein